MENLYDKRIKARKGALWLKVLWIILCSLVYFWIFELITLIVSQYAIHGFTTAATHRVYRFLAKVMEGPGFVFSAYGMWFSRFLSAKTYSWPLFIPLLVPLLFLLILFNGCLHNRHLFALGKKTNGIFAALQDVLKMKILGGRLMFLGRFEGKSLGLHQTASLFGWGAAKLGKTSSIAIPSILESNNSSVVSVSNDDTLFKATSGHRNDIGHIFYFDWNQTDNPETGEFWPRWNPLSNKDMPQKSEKRDLYIKRLAEHLLPQHEDPVQLALYNRTIECLLNFFVYKIEQACANDYLLGRLIETGGFGDEDKSILLSYYAAMPQNFTQAAVTELEHDHLTTETYFPVGSWNGIPSVWKGKELCLPMITDCLIQKHLQTKTLFDNNGWTRMIEEYLQEASLFGYGSKIIEGLEMLLELEQQRRHFLFINLLQSLNVFKKEHIRQRTSSSDYSLKFARGMKDEEGNWSPSTTYLIANNHESAFMTRLMTDMLIERNLEKHKSSPRNPLLFIIDNLEHQPKFESLTNGLLRGNQTNTAFLLLSDSLKNLNDIYGKNGTENIIAACTYKLVFADNNIDLSRQFREMAVYGTKSVQLPAGETENLPLSKQGLADAGYYRRIADSLIDNSGHKIEKGEHLLLAEGFYNLPVKVDTKYYWEDVRFKTLSEKEPVCYLNKNLLQKRNQQDIEVPCLEDVLKEIAANDTSDTGSDDEKKEETAAISEQLAAAAEPQNWWLKEEAFKLKDNEERNPFGKK